MNLKKKVLKSAVNATIMNIDTLVEYGKYVVSALAIFGITIEVSPIKISPLSWLGNRMNGDLIKRIENLEKENIINKAERYRNEILSFANSCRNGKGHTVEEFDNIMDTIYKYENLCEANKWIVNGKTVYSIKYLENLYTELSNKGEFCDIKKCNSDLIFKQ